MKNQYTVVFSAWRAANDLIANMEASKRVREYLTGCDLPHWDAVGAYKEDGQATHKQGVSHIVHCDESDVEDLIAYACVTHNQGYVLVIKSDDNSASLESLDNSIDLGTLQQVSKDEAHSNLAYTYFLGNYYICK
jgi:hypothetical protein